MKDMAMEIILALGSGIVLAMFGIGVPDLNETKKAIEVFSKDVSDVIDKTFGSLMGDSVQVSEFTAAQTNLLRTIRAVPGLSDLEKDTVALIIERATRNAVEQQSDLSLDGALTSGKMSGAGQLLRDMDSLNTEIDTVPDKIARLLTFQKNAQKGRTFAQTPLATFLDTSTINDANVAEDANRQFAAATQLFSPQKPTQTIPLSPVTKKPRTGQQTVVQGDLRTLYFALNDTGAEPAANNGMINVWFAMTLDMDDDFTPYMAARKRKNVADISSPWINHDGSATVALLNPLRAGGTLDQNSPNVRIWQFEIERFAAPETMEIAFFLNIGDSKNRGLTIDNWLPYYAQTIEHHTQENMFFETFLSSILRANDQVGP